MADALESGARDVVVGILRARGLEQLARAVGLPVRRPSIERALCARERVVELGARQQRAQAVLIIPCRDGADRDSSATTTIEPRTAACARPYAERRADDRRA